MELKIDPEAVNKLVADAVLNSAIGEAVKKAIEKELANLSRSWENPLEIVVRHHVADIARKVLIEEHGQAIREKIAAALAEKLSNDFIDRVCEKAAEKY